MFVVINFDECVQSIFSHRSCVAHCYDSRVQMSASSRGAASGL